VTVQLNKFQKQLCSILQEPLLICATPFEALAEKLVTDESTVISETENLKSLGLIRRFCASVNCRALGKTATLVTAHVPDDDLAIVTTVINALPGVSHNYLRDHHYNLWFTLQADSDEQLQTLLKNLSSRLGIQFCSLPATRLFKLNVHFAMYEPDSFRHSEIDFSPACPEFNRRKRSRSGSEESQSDALKVSKPHLNDFEKTILVQLQSDLEISSRPFDFLVTGTADIDTVIRTIQSLVDKRVIRRIGAVLNYHKLGFDANVMFCAHVEPEKTAYVGAKLARLKIVSHCYERKTFQGWHYNLLAMMHAQTLDHIRAAVDKFTSAEQIEKFELLPTIAELKKQPVRHDFS
jgi:DNA-binding Lrp family transcriptional regulator